MKQFSIIAACLVLAACAAPTASTPDTPATTQIETVQVKDMKATADERAACDKAGGAISRQGMLGGEMCVIPYPDAGDVCTDNSDCQGQCRVDPSLDTPDAMKATSGTCQVDTSPFGCYATVENGKGTPMLCVD